mgnify:CR=1 FL=1
MALVHSRIAAPTRAERLALGAAAALSTWVADRMERREARRARTLERLRAEEEVSAARTAERARAHLLGLR